MADSRLKGAYCLAHPSHMVQKGNVICPICGTLVADTLLGSYAVQRLLGQGRSGKSYKIMHTQMQQPATLKLFPFDPACQHLWEATRREVRTVSSLQQHSILPVFRSVVWHPRRSMLVHHSYLLTFCQYTSWSLADVIGVGQRKRLTESLPWMIRFVQQIGAALNAAHEHKIVHGALVPGNILLDQEQCWLADFALARLHPPPAPYLAPELEPLAAKCLQKRNMEAYWQAKDPAGDQYALGIILQQLFSSVLEAHQYSVMMPVLYQATQKNPLRRFQTIAQFTNELVTRLTQLTMPTSVYSGYRQLSMPSSSTLAREATTETLKSSSEKMLVYKGDEDLGILGDRHFTSHNYEEAIKVYQLFLKRQPRDALRWGSLGDAHFALEQHTEALRAYNQAISVDPGDADVWLSRGTTLDAMGSRKEALASYERARLLRE